MRILVTGAAGMLGLDLCRAALAAGHETLALPRAKLDVTDPAAVERTVGAARPDIVVNCAAWTDVDGAQDAYHAALAVNGSGAANVARAAARSGAWTIHVSSDYVFDGAKREPYLESDPVGPLSAYGLSKLAGERAVAAAAPESHTVVRSSWLFGAGGACFPATILRRARGRAELTVVDDQLGCPTFTGHLAAALLTLAGGADEVAEPAAPGLLHVAGGGHCSWYELAREVIARAGLACEVRPGSTRELARPAPRPAYSVLGTERGSKAPALPHWRDGVAAFLAAAVPA
ncbi:MAG: dTDP-4-dehydrorhamnose reductase [Solirubrobacteraceae bacterium]